MAKVKNLSVNTPKKEVTIDDKIDSIERSLKNPYFLHLNSIIKKEATRSKQNLTVTKSSKQSLGA